VVDPGCGVNSEHSIMHALQRWMREAVQWLRSIAVTGRTIIDGEFVDGGAGRHRCDDPATGEALAEQASPMRAMWTGPWPPRRACHEAAPV
jgi:hypothetical protein